MVNIRTRVATGNSAFSSYRNTASTERSKLQYTKIPLYIERFENPSFHLIGRRYLSLNTMRRSGTILRPVLINKSLFILRCNHVLT